MDLAYDSRGIAAALALFWVLALMVPRGAGAEGPAPTASAPSTERDAVALPADVERQIRRRAQDIRALVAGTLDPSVDARALFQLDLADPELRDRSAELLDAVVRELPARLAADKRRARRRASKAPDDPVADLREAMIEFLTLAPDERAGLLSDHDARRQALAAEQQARAEQVEALRARRADLAAFLRGELALDVDPRALLRVDLGADDELALDASRRERANRALVEPSRDPDEAAQADALAQAQAELDRTRIAYLRLSPDERKQLFERHQERREQAAAAAEAEPQRVVEEVAPEATQKKSEAEQDAVTAAEARRVSLEKAEAAKSEAKRAIANEEARLHGIEEAQALLRASLAEREQGIGESHELALEWARKVQEALAWSPLDKRPEPDFDALYQDLRVALGETRRELEAVLDEIGSSEVSHPGEPFAGRGIDAALLTPLAELHAELQAAADELLQSERSLRWQAASSLRDDIVIMNIARLELLEQTSRSLRARVTGFGADGVRQVEREIEQITLELRFHLLRLPGHARALGDDFRTAPLPLLFALFQLAVVLIVFRWWRRRADHVLEYFRERVREGGGQAGRGLSTALYYLKRVRRPLEWLVLFTLLIRLVADLDELPEIRFIWLVLAWFLTGSVVIYALDAIAARQQMRLRGASDTSALRIRSLRLVGVSVVVIGLILSLAEESVGRGAIYSWVLGVTWVLAFPVLLLLLVWWRPVIFERIAGKQAPGPTLSWVLAQREGWTSFAAAGVGAGYLLGSGLWRWLMLQASELDSIRRLLAYLFRREVAKQAQVRARQAVDRIGDDLYAKFGIDSAPPDVLATPAREALDDILEVARAPERTLSAVVGERGAGKSVFLGRIRDALGADRAKIVQCPSGGFDALRSAVARSFGLAVGASEQTILDALRDAAPIVICVDDAQRLVTPTIGGLAQLDRFSAFARGIEARVSWVVAAGAAAWQFVRQTRGERVFFNQVVRLPGWDESEIAQLVQSRTKAAGIEPSFETLVVPRQLDEGVEAAARTEKSFLRILWDYSDGNPAVALHFWRESLFVNRSGSIVVQLFQEPEAEALEALPLTVQFVLRALVQTERATRDELVVATNVPVTDVEDALRFVRARGYVLHQEGWWTIDWPWYRAITTVLKRQHLLNF